MTSGIFLIQDDESLVQMNEEPYDSEDLLQSLLEKYPTLLAGDQMESNDPRRWLLVCREMGVPGEESGGNRWSVDHLFLDQDARIRYGGPHGTNQQEAHSPFHQMEWPVPAGGQNYSHSEERA